MTLSVPLRDGGRLWARRHGDPTAPVTVVLVHGWCLDSRSWDLVTGRLTDPGAARRPGPDLQVVEFDLRGHGRSSSVVLADATIGRLAEDLGEVVDSLVPSGTLVLVGHSMGGMAIMELAADRPDWFARRVHGAVLVSTTAHTAGTLRTGLDHAVRRAELGMHRVLRVGGRWRPHRPLARPLLRPGMRLMAFGEPADPAQVRLAADMIASNPALTIGGFRPAIEAHSRLDALHALADVPIEVLVGTRDRLTPPAAAVAIAEALPHARHEVLSRAGHMLPQERPDEVAAAIRRVAAAAVADDPPWRRTVPAP
jgi:pimeloyl-ACP methyl ester carboxylesterase